jgi:hypothetical protein
MPYGMGKHGLARATDRVLPRGITQTTTIFAVHCIGCFERAGQRWKTSVPVECRYRAVKQVLACHRPDLAGVIVMNIRENLTTIKSHLNKRHTELFTTTMRIASEV